MDAPLILDVKTLISYKLIDSTRSLRRQVAADRKVKVKAYHDFKQVPTDASDEMIAPYKKTFSFWVDAWADAAWNQSFGIGDSDLEYVSSLVPIEELVKPSSNMQASFAVYSKMFANDDEKLGETFFDLFKKNADTVLYTRMANMNMRSTPMPRSSIVVGYLAVLFEYTMESDEFSTAEEVAKERLLATTEYSERAIDAFIQDRRDMLEQTSWAFMENDVYDSVDEDED